MLKTSLKFLALNKFLEKREKEKNKGVKFEDFPYPLGKLVFVSLFQSFLYQLIENKATSNSSSSLIKKLSRMPQNITDYPLFFNNEEELEKIKEIKKIKDIADSIYSFWETIINSEDRNSIIFKNVIFFHGKFKDGINNEFCLKYEEPGYFIYSDRQFDERLDESKYDWFKGNFNEYHTLLGIKYLVKYNSVEKIFLSEDFIGNEKNWDLWNLWEINIAYHKIIDFIDYFIYQFFLVDYIPIKIKTVVEKNYYYFRRNKIKMIFIRIKLFVKTVFSIPFLILILPILFILYMIDTIFDISNKYQWKFHFSLICYFILLFYLYFFKMK